MRTHITSNVFYLQFCCYFRWENVWLSNLGLAVLLSIDTFTHQQPRSQHSPLEPSLHQIWAMLLDNNEWAYLPFLVQQTTWSSHRDKGHPSLSRGDTVLRISHSHERKKINRGPVNPNSGLLSLALTRTGWKEWASSFLNQISTLGPIPGRSAGKRPRALSPLMWRSPWGSKMAGVINDMSPTEAVLDLLGSWSGLIMWRPLRIM